jgi:hypothetical protein
MAGEAHRDKNGEIGETGRTSADGRMEVCGGRVRWYRINTKHLS